LIAASDLVISMRFHASTCALASGTPLIDVTHHAKNRQLLADTGMQQIEVPYEEISQKLLVQSAQASSSSNKEQLNAYLVQAAERWNNFKYEWNDWLASLMESNNEK
jgi:polysaccharide pyruvyl transferase WcaK-like protein